MTTTDPETPALFPAKLGQTGLIPVEPHPLKQNQTEQKQTESHHLEPPQAKQHLGGPGRDDLAAAAWWSWVAEPDDATALAVRTTAGDYPSWQAVVSARTGDDFVAAVGGAASQLTADRLRKGWARWQSRTLADPEALLQAATTRGIVLLTPQHPLWPNSVDSLGAAAPRHMWIRSENAPTWPQGTSITVVGSRASTEYGTHVTGDWTYQFAAAGYRVLSGAAYGVDAAAHRAALAAGGVTGAVVACGLDLAYPVAHRDLLDRIARDGFLLSEYPPGRRVARYRFLARNRVLAALGDVVLVVEAATRSGALSTASWGGQLGRPVAAVPGPVTVASSAGCHRVIRDMAGVLVTHPDHVMALLPGLDAQAEPTNSGAVRPRDELSRQDARVCDALPARRPTTVAAICAESGLARPDVVASLQRLHVAGYADQRPTGDPDDGWVLA